MVGYWKLDETTANSCTGGVNDSCDSSGGGSDGAWSGDATASTSVPTTNFTNPRSVTFDGTGDYITTANIADNLSAMTVAFWFNTSFTQTTGTRRMTFLSKMTNSGNGAGWQVRQRINSDPTPNTIDVLTQESGGAAWKQYHISTAYNDGTWHHFAWTLSGGPGNGATFAVYIYGVSKSLTNLSVGTFSSISTSQNVIMGKDGDGSSGSFYNGKMDDVRIYDRALSSTEITDLAAGNHTSATWTGTSSTNYETAGNWNPSAIPDPYTKITIADVANDPLFTANVAVAGLTINASAILDTEGFNVTMNDAAVFTNNGTFRLKGTETLTSFTNDTDSGTIIYDGTTSITGLSAGNTYNDLTFDGSGGAWTLGAALDVNDDLTLTAGTLDVSGSNFGITVGGDWTDTGAGTFTEGTGTVTFDGTGTLNANETFNNVTINSGGTVTLGAALDLADTLTISGGALDVSGSNYGINLKSWTDTGAGTFTEGSGTVTFDVAGGTINSNETFENVTINHAGTTTLGAALDLDDTLTITGGALDVSGSNYGITLKSWTDTGPGTFTEQGGTVTFDITGGTINSNETFENITINHAGTTTLGAALDLDDTLTITGGALDVSGSNYGITLKSWTDTGTGTFTEQSGTVTFDIAGGTINSNEAFNSVTINHAGTSTLGANTAIGGVFTITSGTLSASSYTITLSGTGTVFSNSGTYTAGTSTISITDTSSTSKTFAGGGGTFNDLTITGAGTGAVILTGANTFSNFTINAPKTITFPASTTTTITGTFSCTGSSGNLITINSSTTNTTATLSKASGTVSCDYLYLSDSTATGGATWNPGTNSTSVSNNSGWVFNTAPSFTAGPSDNGSYASNPTRNGNNVSFTATATDSDSDNYYLAICKTNSITAVNSGAPTCGGGSWCISSATASGSQASCSYTALETEARSNDWYAFVCDNNSSSFCSSVSQASGNDGSPFNLTISYGGGGSSGGSGGIVPQTPKEDQDLIDKLLKLIESLKLQIQALIDAKLNQWKSIFQFTKDLKPGDVDQDVKPLQQFLNKNNYTVSLIGPGSLGNETNIFGPKTKAALAKFQEAHYEAILKPAGFTRGTGWLGPYSRKLINEIMRK